MTTFTGFTEQDFLTFSIDGLDERMEAIRRRIQPKFRMIGTEIAAFLSEKIQTEMYIHVARHARRTVNPPNDTWVAFSHHKRGYKKHPHFQIGLWDDRLFIWLAYIYELPNKQQFAETFIAYQDELEKMIPKDFDISMNHMRKSNERISEVHLREKLERFHKVKSAEFLIGKQYTMTDPIVADGKLFKKEVKSILRTLIPVYQLSLEQIS